MRCKLTSSSLILRSGSLYKELFGLRQLFGLLLGWCNDLCLERSQKLNSILVAKRWQYPMIPASEILKHRIFASVYCFPINHEWLLPEQRLYRNHSMRNNHSYFMLCAVRIGE